MGDTGLAPLSWIDPDLLGFTLTGMQILGAGGGGGAAILGPTPGDELDLDGDYVGTLTFPWNEAVGRMHLDVGIQLPKAARQPASLRDLGQGRNAGNPGGTTHALDSCGEGLQHTRW